MPSNRALVTLFVEASEFLFGGLHLTNLGFQLLGLLLEILE
jgi:hypothetical protein